MSIFLRPRLDAIEIIKTGNAAGEMIIRGLPGPEEVRLSVMGSLPLSQTNKPPSAKESFIADTIRQTIFEAMCHALRLAYDGIHTPYRFFDKNGKKYNLDSSSTYWLLKTKKHLWENTTLLEDDALMLKYLGKVSET